MHPALVGMLPSLAEVLRSLAHAVGAPKVLCADDDSSVRELCAVTLAKAGFVTDVASNGREVLEKVRTNDYGAILLDLSMPSIHGATILNLLEREQPELLRRIIVVTGMPDAVVATVGGVSAVLRKPVNLDTLVSEVNACCARGRASRRSANGDATVRL